MNLINDLDTEIAFAVLFEKKHQEKLKSKDILSLIGRVNKALQEITEKTDDETVVLPDGAPGSRIIVH